MHLHVWTDLAPSRQAQAILTAIMHDVGIRCVDMTLGLLRLQLHFTCSSTLFLSFEVRACCDSAVDFTGKKMVSVVVILKSKSPVISTCLSKESALAGVFVDFAVARGELPSPCYGCWLCASAWIASPRGIKLSLRTSTCRSNSVYFHFTQTFPEKSLSFPIMPCSRAFFNVRNRAFPMSDCM